MNETSESLVFTVLAGIGLYIVATRSYRLARRVVRKRKK
jgi:hypothetical protein